MHSSTTVPEVSLITSWFVPGGKGARGDLVGLRRALEEGVNLFDLYFLDHEDIPWYWKAAGLEDPDDRFPRGPTGTGPTLFAARLTAKEIERVANRLQAELTRRYNGLLVGRRPRFVALATYFPNVSLLSQEEPKDDEAGYEWGANSRAMAIRAMRNAVYLAYLLGCHCVEMVGGGSVPGPAFKVAGRRERYKDRRRDRLARAFREIYNVRDPKNPLSPKNKDSKVTKPKKLPAVALELEPGPPFLLNSLDEVVALLKAVDVLGTAGTFDWCSKVTLNIDIAHAFLMGLEPRHIIRRKLQNRVAHMHISDHGGHQGDGGAHAADLLPGTFHFYEEYKPWLEFAIDRAARSTRFSRAIAVELEAANMVSTVLAAIGTTRRWLQIAADERAGVRQAKAPKGLIPGALLVVDIGNSTKKHFEKKRITVDDCRQLEQLIAKACSCVHELGGSVMSFTGDGFIALFEESQFSSPEEAARRAKEAAKEICRQVHPRRPRKEEGGDLTVRAALHWGKAYIPTSGRLRDQVIGRDVVCATRLCDWLSHQIEPAVPEVVRGTLIGATNHFRSRDKLRDKPDDKPWTRWGEQEFKGLGRGFELYLLGKVTVD
ncbi:MAG: TIM barrel protein [Candidatus Hydrogenedentes bacterium]|nr:TIM barrel protein [Candidatus Hydrogenedentota bacterium]